MEALFLRNLMTESGLGTSKMGINLHTDSTAAKSIVARSGPGKKSKHIELKCLFLQELIQDGQVRTFKVSAHDNHADLMTKYLNGDILKRHSHTLGCHDHAESHDIYEC